MTDSVLAARPEPRSRARFAALAGLALAFAWPLFFAIPGVSTHRLTNVRDDLVNVGVKWLVVAVLGAIAFGVQRFDRADLGIRRLGGSGVLTALAAVLLSLGLGGIIGRLVHLPSSVTDLRALASVPLAVRIAVVLTAAFCEEFIYRGFMIEELAVLTGRRAVAALLSLVLFGVGHAGLYGVSAALLLPTVIGAVLTGLYLWKRNLGACVLAHAILDGIFLLIAPAVVRTT